MHTLTFTTSEKRQIIDITDDVAGCIDRGDGVAIVFVQHTTAAITIIDLDPGTDTDFLEFLEAITPDIKWRHMHDPSHAPDHILAGLIGPSVVIPYENGELQLGTWQRVVLVELDGGRKRNVIVS